jgi:zinc D-Ala-D-Ala carboxypeptidase
MNLSRNFTLQELIKSDTAVRLDINNNPNSGQIEKLKALCENILQPVRDHFGRVKVTSGFRSEQLCIKIGSSVNSQHAKAEAADFECMGTDNAELADWIYANLEFDQLTLQLHY